MKKAEKQRFTRALQRQMRNLFLKDDVALLLPRSDILRGFLIEGSIDPSGVYVWAFAQPLFVPNSTFDINLGKRLGGSKFWSLTDIDELVEVARTEGIEYLSKFSTVDDLTKPETFQSRHDPYLLDDPYVQEIRACSLILTENFSEAKRVLRKMIESLNEKIESLPQHIQWMSDLKERAVRLYDELEKSPEGALELVNRTQSETIKELGLENMQE